MNKTIPELYHELLSENIEPWDCEVIINVSRVLPGAQSKIFFLLIYFGLNGNISKSKITESSITLEGLPREKSILSVLSAYLRYIGSTDENY